MICAACGVLIAVIIGVIVFFATQKEPQKLPPQTGDDSGEPWFVPKNVWNAEPVTDEYNVSAQEFVVIIHTASGFCRFMEYCSQEVLNMQKDHMTSTDKLYSDIAYNFVVGGDGRVYEGRGWNVRGAHTAPLNSRALGVAFIGDYRSLNQNSSLTPRMIANTQRLLREGVQEGGLREDYKLVPHCQVDWTESPGDNVYNVIKKWDHFSNFTLEQRGCYWPEANFTASGSHTILPPVSVVLLLPTTILKLGMY